MSQLEDNIRMHADFFDDHEPSSGHAARFIKRLNKQNTARRITFWRTTLKIAATALIFITASYFAFYLLSKSKMYASGQVTVIQLGDDLNEVFDYYDASSKIKVEEIEQFAVNPEEAQRIQKQAGKQLGKLDAKLAAIEKEYIKNPGNKQLRAALVNTKRKKAEVMNQIVKHMEMAHAGYYSINTESIQF
jgi:hypothetical protein